MSPEQLEHIGEMVVPVAIFLGLFTFLTIAVWLGNRRKEREAFYKSETLRRFTEASGEGAKAAIDLLREDDRLKRIKSREGVKLGGAICTGVGLALVIFLWIKHDHTHLIGLIPMLIGVAMLAYVYFMAVPVE